MGVTYQAKRTRKADASYKGDGEARVKGQRYPITYSGLTSQWKRIRKTAGVTDFRFHDFRHDLATKLLRATGNLKIVQKALSHADIKTTTRYAHVLDEEVATAMESLQNSAAKSRTKSRTRKPKTA
jgi:integrase